MEPVDLFFVGVEKGLKAVAGGVDVEGVVVEAEGGGGLAGFLGVSGS